jgi:hypothetical protein
MVTEKNVHPEQRFASFTTVLTKKKMCCVSAIELPMNMNKIKWLKIVL